MMILRTILTCLTLSLLILVSCSTPEPLTDEDETEPSRSPYIELSDDVVDEFVFEDLDDFDRMLVENRSMLTDQFDNLRHDMPEVFTREIVRDEREVDQYAGFRVQILSTRDVEEADSIRDEFMAWADSSFHDYKPDAYVLFRQPYYRVRTGDFHDREMAIEFSRLVKIHYPDAWIVHDRVEPQNVPADTVEIRFKDPEDILQPVDPDSVYENGFDADDMEIQDPDFEDSSNRQE